MKLFTNKVPKLYIKGGTKSGSAKRLAAALTSNLGYKVWRSDRVFPKKKALVYGAGVGKLEQYQWFRAQDIPSLEFTTSPSQAAQWAAEGHTVFGRKLLNASCGKGIVVYDKDSEIPTGVPVFTKYKKKKREFRVHVFRDTVIRVVEKKLRKDWDGPRDSKIRNLANGFVFCSCTDEPNGLRELAIKAGAVVGSDFKGVDIGYNEKNQELFVLEVNSAPGIQGSNVDAYVQAILA